MKIFFISTSIYILYKVKDRSNDKTFDTFKIEYILIAALIASKVVNYEISFPEAWRSPYRTNTLDFVVI